VGLLVGCTPEGQSAEAVATSTGSVHGESESTSSDPEPSDFLGPRDLGTPESFECNQWTQNCPAGAKCMPYANDGASSWNATRCSPIAARPVGLGEPCSMLGNRASGLDDCDLGLMCWDVDHETLTGHCIAMCAGDSSNPICASPGGHCVQSGSGVLNLCHRRCNPLAQDCPEGKNCVLTFSGNFLCGPEPLEEPKGTNTPCEYFNECERGHVCAAADQQACPEGAGACCRPICDVATSGPPCAPLEACLPWEWFPGGDVPRGLEDVGYCALP